MAGINWITRETIISYILQMKDKNFRQKENPTVEEWNLVYYGYHNSFDFYINISEDWVYVKVPLLRPEIKINARCRQALFHYMLQLNNIFHFVKLSIGSGDRVLLSMEIPAESFDFNSFRNTIEGITYYLDQYGMEISIVAQQPEFACYIETGELKLIESTNFKKISLMKKKGEA